jgi:hypothetical protein
MTDCADQRRGRFAGRLGASQQVRGTGILIISNGRIWAARARIHAARAMQHVAKRLSGARGSALLAGRRRRRNKTEEIALARTSLVAP